MSKGTSLSPLAHFQKPGIWTFLVNDFGSFFKEIREKKALYPP